MRSHEIRERFLRFFEDNGHHRLPSASLIPHDDPSLLFVVAGMVPLKPFISGQRTPPSSRLTSCQKCFRGSGLAYDDIASVGDSSHHTFFEMLGNWSIGDYFKEGAIDFAWELSTKVFGLDPERIWPSVFPDDTVAELIWTDKIGVPRDRIARLAENWWAAGPTGPCGYDSEMYWDFGAPCSCGRPSCTPQDECGGDRWLEFWNLVFMEFDQQPDGSRPLLPAPTVDTGMSLERITAVIQGVRSNYETDLFAPLLAGFRARAGLRDGSPAATRSLNVLADHLRGASFLIADGVFPSNEGRGYVLRRVIRRAAVHGRRVQLTGGLTAGVAELVDLMGPVYPELRAQANLIERTLRDEEVAFARTLEEGTDRLEALLADGATAIAGNDAFRLYDTFGLPAELTVEMAAERGATVDLEGFRSAMEEQRARSRAAHERVGFEAGANLPTTQFVGYDTLEAEGRVLRIGASEERERLPVGEVGELVLDISPFYAESGGQTGDIGSLEWPDGTATVLDTVFAAGSKARLHMVRVERGELCPGVVVWSSVDPARRAQVARHHSATHLLNRALREVLGEGVIQRGSFVGPDHTTFDFSFSRPLTGEELAGIEHRINNAIRRDLERSVREMSLPDARASGAIALLDESYSELVRVVDFGGWSRELCGGTHVGRSGELGAAILVSESSVGQGVRRIDMVVGEAAELRWRQDKDALQTAARALKARLDEVPQRVTALQDHVKRLSKEVEQARRSAGSGAGIGAAIIESINGTPLVHLMLDDADAGDGLVGITDRLFAERLNGNGIAVVLGDRALAVKVGGSALDAGVKAGDLVSAGAAATGGRGGGAPRFAQGSVGDKSKRDAAVATIRESVSRTVGNG